MTTSSAATPMSPETWDEGTERLPFPKRVRVWFSRTMPMLGVAVLLLVITALFFYSRIVITINEGQEGVLWRRFGGGTVIDTVYLEGTHFIMPWNRMTIYETRLQRADQIVSVLSADGLEIKVDVSVRYRPTDKSVPQLHQKVGPDYLNRVILPEVLTAVREVMGQYKPEQLYALRTDEMQDEIVARASVQVRDRFVVIDDVLIRGIELPPPVQQAIQQKLVQQQEALQYAYRIEKEKQEKERKRIEAEGIQAFQEIVGRSISAPLLRWKGIEATLELAKSNNAKVVVVGNGGDGLPLILNMPGLPGELGAPNTPAGPVVVSPPAPGRGAPTAPQKSGAPAKSGRGPTR